MRKTCQWLISVEMDEVYGKLPPGLKSANLKESPCGKPAVAYIDWGGGTVYWYCAKHFDQRIEFIRECGRTDVLKLSGVR